MALSAKTVYSASQEKPLSTFAIMELRLKFQGLHEQFQAKYKEIKEETGKRHMQVMYLIQKCPEFGYTTPKAEQEWFEQHKATLLMDAKRAKTSEKVRKHRKNKAEQQEQQAQKNEEQEFVNAIRNLPATAPYEIEFDWLRSHPAISRLAFHGSDTKKVKITVEDILKSPNGKCPSQAVAYQLINAANQPANTVKATFAKMLKAVSGEVPTSPGNGKPAASEWDNADDASELESLLKKTKEQIDSAKS